MDDVTIAMGMTPYVSTRRVCKSFKMTPPEAAACWRPWGVVPPGGKDGGSSAPSVRSLHDLTNLWSRVHTDGLGNIDGKKDMGES